MANNSNRNIAQEILDAIAAGASPEYVSGLNSERNDKIAANQTHYDAKGITSSDSIAQAALDYVNNYKPPSTSASANSGYNQYAGTTSGTTASSTSNPYAGTDYHQNAIDAAIAGDWEAVKKWLNLREEKVAYTGLDHGRTSEDIFNELWNKYGQQGETTDDGFSYGGKPGYYDAYSVRIDNMLNDILNREDFSYNAAEDPLYQQYKEQYQREGDRAMKDTLGQVSARTGGMASSYAQTAAQQANQYYAQQLADKIPELYQLAYEMYLNDIDNQVRDLGLLESASDRDYTRYRDTMSDWYNDRNFAYDAYRNDIADEQWQTEFDYNAERDKIADERYDTEWQYQLDRDKIEDSRYDTEWAHQVAQDALAQENWNKEFGLAEKEFGLNQSKFNYQKQQDALEVTRYNDGDADGKSGDSSSDKSGSDSSSGSGNGDGKTTSPVFDGSRTEAAIANYTMMQLGLGGRSEKFINDLFVYGGLIESGGTVKWASGWNASNCEAKLKEKKDGGTWGVPLLPGLRDFG